MKNNFENVMSKRTNEELTNIINSSSGDYQLEAVKAAEQEIKKRQFVVEKLSEYSDEQILEILNSKNNYQEYEIQAAEAEANKRNISSIIDEEMSENAMQEQIKKLKTDVSKERYPALKLISTLFKVLAWLVVILVLIMLISMFSQGELGLPIAIGILIGGGISFVSLFAIAESIKVFIDIEYNTRISVTNSKK